MKMVKNILKQIFCWEQIKKDLQWFKYRELTDEEIKRLDDRAFRNHYIEVCREIHAYQRSPHRYNYIDYGRAQREYEEQYLRNLQTKEILDRRIQQENIQITR